VSTNPTLAAPAVRPQSPREHPASPPPPLFPPTAKPDELLVVDSRAALTPAQMVERKLVSLLKGETLPVSHMRLLPRPRGRG
jgi:hypothetical protein